jgi:hypothetical protein
MSTENDNSKRFSFLNKKLFGLIRVRVLVGAFAGLLIGLLYFHFFGCRTNSCAITSNPLITSAFFMVFGILLSTK